MLSDGRRGHNQCRWIDRGECSWEHEVRLATLHSGWQCHSSHVLMHVAVGWKGKLDRRKRKASERGLYQCTRKRGLHVSVHKKTGTACMMNLIVVVSFEFAFVWRFDVLSTGFTWFPFCAMIVVCSFPRLLRVPLPVKAKYNQVELCIVDVSWRRIPGLIGQCNKLMSGVFGAWRGLSESWCDRLESSGYVIQHAWPLGSP